MTTATTRVIYKVTAEQDHLDVRGNAMASGNDAEDRAAEDEIIARLEAGDVWAWATVTVTAELSVDGETYYGRAYLGACNYRDEDDFKTPGGYYDDMLQEALDGLKNELRVSIQHGKVAELALKELGS